jgi:tol-pal system protein YbgF
MRRFAFTAAAVLLLLSSCVSSGDLRRLEDRVIDLHDEIQALKREAGSKEEVERLNTELAQRTQSILRSSAEVSAKVDALADRVENTQGSVEQTNYRIDRLVQQITQNEREIAILRAAIRSGEAGDVSLPSIQEEVVVGQPSRLPDDPIQVYQSAYRDFQRGNYELAIEGFAEFIEANPDSDLADNAAYWIGESFYSQRKFKEAIAQFDEVVSRYPRSDRIAAALLKKGLAYIELGQRAQGVVQLQYVVHEHPTTQEASLARERLRAMGIDTR